MSKILFCSWHIWAEWDVSDALKKMGHTVYDYLDKIESVDYGLEYMGKIKKLLDADTYDYVFSINFIPIISRVCNIYKIRYVSWSVDPTEITLYSNAIYNSWNRIFLFDYKKYQKFAPKNPGNVFHMPLGTNVELWDKIVVKPDEARQYQSDISFVGNLYSNRSRYTIYNLAEKLPDYLRGYLDGIMESQLLIYGYNFLEDVIDDRMAEEFKKNVNWTPLGEDCEECVKDLVIHEFIEPEITKMERIRLLHVLSERYHVDVYSEDEVETLPNINYKGIVNYMEDMPKVFKCSKINLNFTAKTISSGIPLRIFDIIGAGGFVITNYQPELSEYFTIGKEIVVYESQKDLLDKTAYYLEHEEERLAIIEAGYKKVREMFTWEARLRDIFKILGE